jgi:D-alanyl-D-alanine carboxypeptidase
MTATLLGTWVARGQLRWQATLGNLIPRLLEKATPEVRGITLEQLLTHRSGFRANREPWSALPAAGSRSQIVRIESARPLEHPPGSASLYSNLGYMIAGVVAETLGGKIWEHLMQERLFAPLKMKAGFGGTGTPGKEDQPWPHGADGQPRPANGPEADNPASLGPAGTCHASMQEYAKFVADHLRGAAGGKGLLPAAIYKDLHAPRAPATYALGWETCERSWGGGLVLTHTGSNTMNYSVVWMAPRKGFAVIAFTNQPGEKAAAACDEACSRLIAGHPVK